MKLHKVENLKFLNFITKQRQVLMHLIKKFVTIQHTGKQSIGPKLFFTIFLTLLPTMHLCGSSYGHQRKILILNKEHVISFFQCLEKLLSNPTLLPDHSLLQAFMQLQNKQYKPLVQRHNLKPLEEKCQMKITRKVAAMFVHIKGIYLFVMTMQKQLIFVQIVFLNFLN